MPSAFSLNGTRVVFFGEIFIKGGGVLFKLIWKLAANAKEAVCQRKMKGD
jgi:hypothetical protein